MVRVIGGEFRSRLLKSLPGLGTRPTPDRLRETLFDILSERIEGADFLDAYAGTGAVGIEALSRGARRAIFIERSRVAAGVIRENLRTLGLGADRAVVAIGKAVSLLSRFHASIVFLDPPYDRQEEYEAAFRALVSQPPELVIAQHVSRFKPAEAYGPLRQFRTVRQGDNSLSFYRVAKEDPLCVE
jgi:16S rRNA (guanine(966)-N(2))-methyltransferase RsmD